MLRNKERDHGRNGSKRLLSYRLRKEDSQEEEAGWSVKKGREGVGTQVDLRARRRNRRQWWGSAGVW